jgi:hypothetical protein
MASAELIKQPLNIGVRRELAVGEREHVILLLRIIERLPILSTLNTEDAEALKRQLAAIHQNHVDLAQMATSFLSPSTG